MDGIAIIIFSCCWLRALAMYHQSSPSNIPSSIPPFPQVNRPRKNNMIVKQMSEQEFFTNQLTMTGPIRRPIPTLLFRPTTTIRLELHPAESSHLRPLASPPSSTSFSTLSTSGNLCRFRSQTKTPQPTPTPLDSSASAFTRAATTLPPRYYPSYLQPEGKESAMETVETVINQLRTELERKYREIEVLKRFVEQVRNDLGSDDDIYNFMD